MAILEEHASLGTLFIGVALWWTVQMSKRYSYCRHRQYEFTSTVTYPCCGSSCRKICIEGVLKVTFGFVGLLLQTYFITTKRGQRQEYVNSMRFLVIYLMILMSGLTDIVQKIYSKLVLASLDWVVLALTYFLVAILFWSPDEAEAVFPVVNQLEAFAAISCMAVVILEAKWTNTVLLGLTRAFLTFVLGSWMWHIGFLASQDSNNADESRSNHTDVVMASMFFTWHCAVAIILELIIWMLAFKLAQENRCLCSAMDSSESEVYLENRVHFDYHILDRFDSDGDL